MLAETTGNTSITAATLPGGPSGIIVDNYANPTIYPQASSIYLTSETGGTAYKFTQLTSSAQFATDARLASPCPCRTATGRNRSGERHHLSEAGRIQAGSYRRAARVLVHDLCEQG